MNKKLMLLMCSVSLVGCKALPPPQVEEVKLVEKEEVVAPIEKAEGSLFELCREHNIYTDKALNNKEVSFDVVVVSHDDTKLLKGVSQERLDYFKEYGINRYYYHVLARVKGAKYKENDIINITGVIDGQNSSNRFYSGDGCTAVLKQTEPVTTKLVGQYEPKD